MNRFLKVIVAPPVMLFRAIGLRWLMAPAGVATGAGRSAT